MNAPCTIDIAESVEWNLFRTEANLWRGRMIDRFAAVENAMTETLVHVGAARSGKKLPYLAGQRREALRSALSPDASTGGTEKAVLDAMAQFEHVVPHRTFLCHGAGQILIDQRRQWHLHLTVLEPDNNPNAETAWIVSKSESEKLLAVLNSSAQRLIDRLANYRKGTPAII
jgi:hypothetical protein